MRYLIISVLFLLATCGCLGKEATSIVEPGYLNSHKDLLDKKKVSVRGVLLYETENTALWDAGGNYPRGNPSHCITVLSSKEHAMDLSRLNHKLVVITGIFSKNFMSTNHIFLGACNITGINVISVVSSSGLLRDAGQPRQ